MQDDESPKALESYNIPPQYQETVANTWLQSYVIICDY